MRLCLVILVRLLEIVMVNFTLRMPKNNMCYWDKGSVLYCKKYPKILYLK